MGSFSFQEVHFSGIPLVILSWILRIVFILSTWFYDLALPSGVAFFFTMDRAINRRVFLMTFLTAFLPFFELGTLFISLGVAVLV